MNRKKQIAKEAAYRIGERKPFFTPEDIAEETGISFRSAVSIISKNYDKWDLKRRFNGDLKKLVYWK